MTNKISDKLKELITKGLDGAGPSLLDLAELNDEDIARLAMLKNLEAMFSPMSQQETTLKAVRMALEFTKAKPASKVEAKFSNTWLEELVEDEPKLLSDDSDDN